MTDPTPGAPRTPEERVRMAAKAQEVAAKALLAAVVDAVPVGTFVEIPRGRGFVRGWVEEHGCWWSDPFRLKLRLLSTGKPCWVHASSLFPGLR